MSESVAQHAGEFDGPTSPIRRSPAEPEAATAQPDPVQQTLTRLVEQIEDLSRVIARQAATIERLTDDAKARAQLERAGADLPLVVELFALHNDSVACASTAESDRERDAFAAVATRVERLLAGRGAVLVTPRPDDPFDSLTMEATDVAPTADPAADRTIDALIQPGLSVSGRSIRPASVVVRRHRPAD
ncbi:nucleotide exchange factor GrpE [Nocardia sp. XZ_19_385]|uniref:nucleotide exchange factor GrpE n=1 Tax=Nocardia sp. XZ_19_385 TaxID=2769488 RepID=UPI00188DDDE6|nr:nucleotide exchange factor GrpE [Nocardia sp. XZ_19_385]